MTYKRWQTHGPASGKMAPNPSINRTWDLPRKSRHINLTLEGGVRWRLGSTAVGQATVSVRPKPVTRRCFGDFQEADAEQTNYRITSSARRSSFCGTRMSIALATRRSTVNSNVDICSMGNSDGFAPFEARAARRKIEDQRRRLFRGYSCRMRKS